MERATGPTLRHAATLRDDRDSGGRRRQLPARNVLGEPLEICSIKPMTGFYRDGCCNTGREDIGSYTVCAVMTSEFSIFPNRAGNDLSTQLPELGFVGLKPGDRWCLCAPAGRRRSKRTKRPASSYVPRPASSGLLLARRLKRFAVDLA